MGAPAGGRVLVGTCSWTDPTLVKETNWYPKRSMDAGERLRYYASKFPLVEADSTYYRPLNPELARSWAERAPEGFSFDIKAYGLLTGHPVEPVTLWPDIKDLLDEEARGKRRVYPHHLPAEAVEEAWARFMAALSPLQRSGHLGGVLLQYPPWFVPKRANRDELARLPERLGDIPGLVEFRSAKWLSDDDRDKTLGLLRCLGLVFVVVDAPGVSGLPTLLEVTRDDLAVVRFHGRADATWDAKNVTAAERFRYLYSDAELAEWVPRAKHLAERASRVQLLMNNCYQDYGVRNAAQLAEYLSQLEE
ncbi:MAG TPA: DUF72 domain-containing protein [Acidimicrobiales bacterium]|nr:DUF72 domain-containing protein [Acidimicrobiales bacterium]